MTRADETTLRRCFRMLGKMAERYPSLIVTPEWQMASEGIARMAKNANVSMTVKRKCALKK